MKGIHGKFGPAAVAGVEAIGDVSMKKYILSGGFLLLLIGINMRLETRLC